MPDAVGEDLEEGHCVGWQVVGIDPDAGAKLAPQFPGGAGGISALARNSCTGRFLDSAPISAKLVAGERVKSGPR